MTEAFSPETLGWLWKISAFLLFLGSTYAYIKIDNKESLRLGHAAHKRLDAIVDGQHKSEIARAAEEARVSAKLDNQTHEQEMMRLALHQTRTEIAERLGRIEDRLDK